jgi:hypothetical protein
MVTAEAGRAARSASVRASNVVRFFVPDDKEPDRMNYDQEEFFDLIEAVESQGGELLDEMCKSIKYEFSGKESKPVTIAGCGNTSIFKVPYNALDIKGKEVGLHPVVVCAVDDDIGKWPRFGGDRFAKIEVEEE